MKTRRQNMEYKKTRRQENETNVLQAGAVAGLSSRSNVLYSRIPVFSYSRFERSDQRIIYNKVYSKK